MAARNASLLWPAALPATSAYACRIKGECFVLFSSHAAPECKDSFLRNVGFTTELKRAQRSNTITKNKNLGK